VEDRDPLPASTIQNVQIFSRQVLAKQFIDVSNSPQGTALDRSGGQHFIEVTLSIAMFESTRLENDIHFESVAKTVPKDKAVYLLITKQDNTIKQACLLKSITKRHGAASRRPFNVFLTLGL
jgi:hypothetical protein